MLKKGESPIPGYRLVSFLGRGQYGEVWSAEAPGGALVALKFIALNSRAGNVELKAIQAVKRIRHANLIPINAIWLLDHNGNVLDDQALAAAASSKADSTLTAEQLQTLDDSAFLVIAMALADASLEDRLREAVESGEQGIPLVELLDYIRQAAKGVDFLNQPHHTIDGRLAGVTHRDIKPANLLLLGDSVVVGDFGVATTLKEFDATATGLLGSLGFMAPESLDQHPSASTDQYALAITYYWLRTNELPYAKSTNVAELMEIHRSGRLTFDHVGDDEKKILRKATAVDPQERFGSCSEFSEALIAQLTGQSPQQEARSNRTIWIAASILVPLLIAAVLFIVQPWKTPPTENAPQEQGNLIKPIDRKRTRQLSLEPRDIGFEVAVTKPGATQPVFAISGTGSADVEFETGQTVIVRAQAKLPFYQSTEISLSVPELDKTDWKIEIPRRAPAAVRDAALALPESSESQAIEWLRLAAMESPLILDIQPADTLKVDAQVLRLLSNGERDSFGCVLLKGAQATPGLLTIENKRLKIRSPQQTAGEQTFIEEIFLLENPERLLAVRADSIWIWKIAEQSESSKNANDSLQIAWSAVDAETRMTVAAISPDQRLLATGDRDGRVRLWDLNGADSLGEPIEQAAHEEAIIALFFDKDGHLISFAQDQTVMRLQLDQGARKLHTEAVPVPATVGSHDITLAERISESSIAVAMENRLLLLQRPFGMQSEWIELGDLGEEITAMTVSAEGRLLVVTHDTQKSAASIYDLEKQKPLLDVPTSRLRGARDVSFSSDSKWMMISGDSGSLLLVDLSANGTDPFLEFPHQASGVCSQVAFTADNKQILSVTRPVESNNLESSTIETWDFRRSLLLLRAGHR